MELLRFPNKKLRARVIKEYVAAAGYRGVVCFSCGNASTALKEAGLYVIDVSPRGELEARKWWTPEDIHRAWPDLFDATSGHLPLPLMVKISAAFKKYLGPEPYSLNVPTGSGETILALKVAYPTLDFRPVYNLDDATKYNPEAPLNKVVEGICEMEIINA